jgi:hypothetical protein
MSSAVVSGVWEAPQVPNPEGARPCTPISVFCLVPFEFRSNHCLDPAPQIEVPPDFTANRLNGSDDIVQYPVGHMFMENPFIPIGTHVQFQGFQLNDLLIRNITDMNDAKIRLTRFGADCRELGTLDGDFVFPARVLIRKGFQL